MTTAKSIVGLEVRTYSTLEILQYSQFTNESQCSSQYPQKSSQEMTVLTASSVIYRC